MSADFSRIPALTPSIRHLAAPVLFLMVLSSVASAREVTPEERAAFIDRATIFSEIANNLDFLAMFDMLPPGIIEYLADEAGISSVEVRAKLAALSEEALAPLLESPAEYAFQIDVSAVQFHELSDGTPYALAPSTTYVAMQGTGVRVVSETLGVMDQGQWYFVRVDELEQILVLQRIYPLFAGVQFNGPVTEVVEP